MQLVSVKADSHQTSCQKQSTDSSAYVSLTDVRTICQVEQTKARRHNIKRAMTDLTWMTYRREGIGNPSEKSKTSVKA